MIRSLDIGTTGMLGQQMNVDIISNNIANMTTTGFKRQRVGFQDLMYQNLKQPGTTSSDSGTTLPSGLQVGLGVRAGAVYRIHGQGSIQVTENPLDLAVTGNGMFQIQLPSGDTAYTRDGSFQINENGQLVTLQGYVVDPGITIPADATNIDINESGEVLATIPGATTPSNVGQIQLASFVNPTGLESLGNNLYMETDASGSPTTGSPNTNEFGAIQQGALEQSNVNAVEEITELITAQRAYEMNSNIITTSDEMLQTVSQMS